MLLPLVAQLLTRFSTPSAKGRWEILCEKYRLKLESGYLVRPLTKTIIFLCKESSVICSVISVILDNFFVTDQTNGTLPKWREFIPCQTIQPFYAKLNSFKLKYLTTVLN